MSADWTKKQVQAMSEVLDGEYETVEEAAGAALSAAEDLLAQRATYTVVGQLTGNSERHSIPPDDPEAIKVALGWYSTEGKARAAAESLWSNASTGDRFAVWILPVHHGTPAELHAKQKEKYAAAEAKRKEAADTRFREGIKKREAAMQERARGGKGSCQTCAHQPYDHGYEGSSKGPCRLSTCSCTKWIERKAA